MTESLAIQLRNLPKKYNGTTVVDHLTLEIPAGTVFGLLGHNGAGKSTTIKMMTGVLLPDSGEVSIAGISVSKDSVAVKRIIGVVPDNLALFDYLTIWEHLDLIRSLFNIDLDVFKERSTQLLEILDLSSDAGQLAKNASSGMRKKTSLAMAMLPNPKVLILDEPFESLDPIVSATMKNLLRRAASRGTTVFLTTHILESIENLVNQYGILNRGSLRAYGTTQELADKGLSLQDAYLREFDKSSSRDLSWLG